VSSYIQILGAVLILTAFALAQARALSLEARTYLALNLIGGSVLAVDAYTGKQWGFLLLEGVWAIIAAYGLVKRRRHLARHRARAR
jgi:hypothetical protein